MYCQIVLPALRSFEVAFNRQTRQNKSAEVLVMNGFESSTMELQEQDVGCN